MEMNKIINGEIKQTQLGITCIASIQYHTQYISINIHSTIYGMTGNAMVKRTNDDLQNTAQKATDSAA
jgi:predicted metal-dependent phosphoesterase TrpH